MMLNYANSSDPNPPSNPLCTSFTTSWTDLRNNIRYQSKNMRCMSDTTVNYIHSVKQSSPLSTYPSYTHWQIAETIHAVSRSPQGVQNDFKLDPLNRLAPSSFYPSLYPFSPPPLSIRNRLCAAKRNIGRESELTWNCRAVNRKSATTLIYGPSTCLSENFQRATHVKERW